MVQHMIRSEKFGFVLRDNEKLVYGHVMCLAFRTGIYGVPLFYRLVLVV